MNQSEITSKTNAYLSTFLEKEGFILLKTEYVKEDGINYLRAYIDLTETEREKRKSRTTKVSGQESDTESVTEEAELDGDEKFPEEEAEYEPGIGINDCALVSRRLSKWLDKEDFIPEEYMLEVCSKGYLN